MLESRLHGILALLQLLIRRAEKALDRRLSGISILPSLVTAQNTSSLSAAIERVGPQGKNETRGAAANFGLLHAAEATVSSLFRNYRILPVGQEKLRSYSFE